MCTTNAKLRITKEKVEQIKLDKKSWIPYEYENHPFRDEDDLLKKTGLLILEKQNGLQDSLLGVMAKTYKAVSADSTKKQGNPIYLNKELH